MEPDEQPYPGLELADLIGRTVGEAVGRAEAAGGDRIRVINVTPGSPMAAIDLMYAPSRLDLVQRDDRIRYAEFPGCRSAGEWPT